MQARLGSTKSREERACRCCGFVKVTDPFSMIKQRSKHRLQPIRSTNTRDSVETWNIVRATLPDFVYTENDWQCQMPLWKQLDSRWNRPALFLRWHVELPTTVTQRQLSDASSRCCKRQMFVDSKWSIWISVDDPDLVFRMFACTYDIMRDYTSDMRERTNVRD